MGSSASVAELPGWAAALCAQERVGRLGVIDDEGGPRVLPVTYAITGGTFVSAIDHKPKRVAAQRLARVRWLRARPRAAITVDRYHDDWSQLAWVQAIGAVRILELDDAPEALAALSQRYPRYRERPPAGPILALRPERLVWWRAT
jgi:PPOX class probable F420-dependent enzyme